MLINEITVQQCQEFLDRKGFGRLGCVHDNQPYIVPIYFSYAPERLYGFSTLGRKIECMRANPRVCVEVDEVASNNSWTSVIVSGRYQELLDTPEYGSERQQAQESLEKRFRWWKPEWQPVYATKQILEQKMPAPTILYCIHVTDMTGRSAVPDAVAWGPG
jgi:nitroimidazol reductase NimA-like FMN-containing flavoprotein (pyridoxamine 5'-phosphate oxidase superfamily)